MTKVKKVRRRVTHLKEDQEATIGKLNDLDKGKNLAKGELKVRILGQLGVQEIKRKTEDLLRQLNIRERRRVILWQMINKEHRRNYQVLGNRERRKEIENQRTGIENLLVGIENLKKRIENLRKGIENPIKRIENLRKR